MLCFLAESTRSTICAFDLRSRKLSELNRTLTARKLSFFATLSDSDIIIFN